MENLPRTRIIDNFPDEGKNCPVSSGKKLGDDSPIDYSNRCEECAGFCCVALEIPKESDGVLTKTANTVCSYLDLDPSGIGHACSVYHARRHQGFDTCLHYRCYGAGPAITKVANEREWIYSDATFKKEAIDLYDLCFRMASYLGGNEELANAAFFPCFKKKPDAFSEDCERIYRKFLSEGILTDAEGNEADVATVRNWFIENIRAREGKLFSFIRVISGKGK